MPDPSTAPHAVYPWQVSVDINENAIIGLTALYDPSTSIDLIKASIDERYGKWALAEFKTGPVKIWRVQPKRFAMNLSTDENGMISVLYLAFGDSIQCPPNHTAHPGDS